MMKRITYSALVVTLSVILGAGGALAAPPDKTANLPPVAVIHAVPHSGPEPLEVEFSGRGSFDPNGDALTYLWDFGEGSPSTDPETTHTYFSPGLYVAVLSVFDGRGLVGSASLMITVEFPPQPIINSLNVTHPGDPGPVTVGEGVLFSLDLNFFPLTFLWDFGDGTILYPSLSPDVVHAYTEPGDYTVRVRATDSKGAVEQASAFVTVIVP